MTGICSLLVSAGMGFFLLKTGMWGELRAAGFTVIAFGYGLYSALGVWEVTLSRVSGRCAWRWGLGVPLFQHGERLTAHPVRLNTSDATSTRRAAINAYTVQIAGMKKPRLLAGSNDYGEALALAEAVARHNRLGLQVDGGRVRPAEELTAPAPARVRALSARLQGSEAGALLAMTRSEAGTTLVPPPEGRFKVRTEGGQQVVDLPAPGWTQGYRLQAVASGVLMLLGAGFGGFVLWSGLPTRASAMLGLMVLMLIAWGAHLLGKTLAGVRTSWSVTVSRRGLEVVQFGQRTSSTFRIATHLIRDIDVRDLIDKGMQVGVFGVPTSPTLVIERTEGEVITLKAGLSREEFEWVAARLRQELAELPDAQRPELSTG